MEIRLDQIVEEPYRWRERRAVAPAKLDRSELTSLSEVDWSGSITPTTSGYLFEARLEYEQTIVCPRCLEPAVHPVAAAVQLLVVPDEGLPTIGEHRLEDDDLSLYPLEGETLDTEPILIEQLQLHVPMRALCREECAGLCPACGVNRNFESCGCGGETTDPRWDALAALRDDSPPRSGDR